MLNDDETALELARRLLLPLHKLLDPSTITDAALNDLFESMNDSPF